MCVTSPFYSDFERPSFTTCPQSQIIYVNRNPDGNQLFAAIDWDIVAVDNSGETPSITCDMIKGDLRPEGNHYVTCKAMDNTGNEATCAFVISVRGRCFSAPSNTNHLRSYKRLLTSQIFATDYILLD